MEKKTKKKPKEEMPMRGRDMVVRGRGMGPRDGSGPNPDCPKKRGGK